MSAKGCQRRVSAGMVPTVGPAPVPRRRTRGGPLDRRTTAGARRSRGRSGFPPFGLGPWDDARHVRRPPLRRSPCCWRSRSRARPAAADRAGATGAGRPPRHDAGQRRRDADAARRPEDPGERPAALDRPREQDRDAHHPPLARGARPRRRRTRRALLRAAEQVPERGHPGPAHRQRGRADRGQPVADVRCAGGGDRRRRGLHDRPVPPHGAQGAGRRGAARARAGRPAARSSSSAAASTSGTGLPDDESADPDQVQASGPSA